MRFPDTLFSHLFVFFFFFFNDTATTEIYTLSLHDALPIFWACPFPGDPGDLRDEHKWIRSEEHTSELQSHLNLVCRLLLEKKKTRGAAIGRHADTSSACGSGAHNAV